MSEEKPKEKPRTFGDLNRDTLLDRTKLEHFASTEREYLKQLTDAAHYQAQPRMMRVRPSPISDFKTHELIMELLSRGFAVIKTPESGVPEVLTEK